MKKLLIFVFITFCFNCTPGKEITHPESLHLGKHRFTILIDTFIIDDTFYEVRQCSKADCSVTDTFPPTHLIKIKKQ